MNVKKVLMVLISLALVCSFAGAVSAENIDVTYTYDDENSNFETESSSQSIVLLDLSDVKPGFTLSIPNTIYMEYNDESGYYEGEAQIELKNIIYTTTLYNYSVDVTSNAHTSWTLDSTDNGSGNLYYYSLSYEDYNGTTGTIASGEIGDDGGVETISPCKDTLADILKVSLNDQQISNLNDKLFTSNLKFKLLQKQVLADGKEYKDTLTFTVNLEEVDTSIIP